jgi:signal transduction histidine kinase
MAQDELARVSQIVTQTLRFYRQTSRPMKITAAQVIHPVIDLFRRRLVQAHITVETHLPSTAQFCCLEGEIRQVLSNLIANAIDALPEGGRIVFHARDAVEHHTGRRGVRISVADNGAGMTATVRSRIFEPFYTTKELNGTGLGLWISTEIVYRHKGTLTVRSTRHPRRHGTVFSLFLPLNSECVIDQPADSAFKSAS